EYLQNHPDFLMAHPELLGQLELSHSCGDAVSLIEHQVAVLKDHNRQLRQKLQGLIDNARENEKLNQRLHRLTLELLVCEDIDQVFTVLYDSLREDFSADKVVLRIFAALQAEGDFGMVEFVDPEVWERELFSSLLRSSRPVCGRLQQEQSQFLFGAESESINSGLLLPLGDIAGFGVLAIGSKDPRRFHPGMGTVFIRNLGEVAARLIRPYLAIP
ncbi:MAG: DUF484 family protein, partial [Gammaproteobacteria bacterium]|nr:DUF484 family protein [Gammaproteobacteria bacterium]